MIGLALVLAGAIAPEDPPSFQPDVRPILERSCQGCHQPAKAKGDYDKAEEKLAEAKEIGDRLALLEQSESQEQVAYNQSLSSSSMRVAASPRDSSSSAPSRASTSDSRSATSSPVWPM